ncbi:MAG TPA: hypothetical protein VHR86_09400 [Armatimonadota bacterium]|nr:hypothetical protein [Armatimonadota bacterium]
MQHQDLLVALWNEGHIADIERLDAIFSALEGDIPGAFFIGRGIGAAELAPATLELLRSGSGFVGGASGCFFRGCLFYWRFLGRRGIDISCGDSKEQRSGEDTECVLFHLRNLHRLLQIPGGLSRQRAALVGQRSMNISAVKLC